jgi:hypothetical protein
MRMACHPESISLPIFCAHSGGAIELQYEAATARDTLLRTAYACPYCRETRPLKIPGRVLWATEQAAKGDITRPSKIQEAAAGWRDSQSWRPTRRMSHARRRQNHPKAIGASVPFVKPSPPRLAQRPG